MSSEPETIDETPVTSDVAEPGGGAGLGPMGARLSQIEEALAALGATLGDLAISTRLIPEQVRKLNGVVAEVTESIGQPRIRGILSDLLQLCDLLKYMLASEAPGSAASANYAILRSQVLQILEVNGVAPMPSARSLDPALHRVVATTPCDDPEEDGTIVSVSREGFKTEQRVLRYAEVTVKRYQPEADGARPKTNEEPPKSADEEQEP